jgi:hypothetical protein
MAVRIGVSYGVTHNLGNYESLRLDVNIAEDIEEGEDTLTAYERLWNVAKEQVVQQLEAYDAEDK